MKTFNFKNKSYGRILSEISKYLIINKKKIKIINHNQVKFNKKINKKFICYHSGFPGGLKKKKFIDEYFKNSKKVIINSLKGMLPKNYYKKIANGIII
ncbi:uL13 family ribosomal protein [Candidatus Vidania fulgoroideorum]